jgi:RNA polymerase sigma-70 factor (ECF subfamily)
MRVNKEEGLAKRGEFETRLRELILARNLHEVASLVLRTYGPEILGYIHNVTNDPVAANEIYSQFAEDFWRGLPNFEPRAMVRTWAFCIARSAIARHFRDPYRKHGRRLITDELNELLIVTTREFFGTHTPPEEKVARIRELLSLEERQLLHLRVDRKMSWDTVATITGGTSVAVRQQFQRLRKKIREQHQQRSR